MNLWKEPVAFPVFGSCPGPLSGSCFERRITVLWQHNKKQSGKTVDYKQQQKNDSNNNSTDWADQVIELDLNC